MRVQTLAASLGLTFAFCAWAPATALADRYEVGIGGGTHFVPMDSMDAISSDTDFGIVSLHAGLKIPEFALLTGFESEVGINWDFGELSGTTFDRIDANLEVDSVTVSGRLRRHLAGPFSAFGDAGLGVQWASLRLSDSLSSDSRPLAGDAKAMVTSLGGGAEAALIEHPKFRMTLRAQASYVVATSMHFDATPMSQGEDTIEISTRSSSLGSINTSGVVLKAGLFGSF